jgi:hypothetical protein
MYLEPGGIRELHWHQTGEWAIMTGGKCRVTTLSREGKPSVEDVFKEDLWFFPAGLPHSLQGLGPDGAEFVIVFDDGSQSESNTLLLTDWFAHTPPDVLAKNFRVAQEVFDDIPRGLADTGLAAEHQGPAAAPRGVLDEGVDLSALPPTAPQCFSRHNRAPTDNDDRRSRQNLQVLLARASNGLRRRVGPASAVEVGLTVTVKSLPLANGTAGRDPGSLAGRHRRFQ